MRFACALAPPDVRSQGDRARRTRPAPELRAKESTLGNEPAGRQNERDARLSHIRDRLIEARRELDALIGDAYLRPRASIVPVHFLDLASAVEKLRWAEKEWRDLDRADRPQESVESAASR